MLPFSIYPTAFFMVRFRWGRDPTLQLYDDAFTEMLDKSEFEWDEMRFFLIKSLFLFLFRCTDKGAMV